MKKSFTLFLSFFLFATVLQAQNPQFSKPINFPGFSTRTNSISPGESPRVILGTLGNDILLYNYGDNSIYKFNANSLVATPKKLDKKFRFDKVVMFNGTIYFFNIDIDKSSKKYNLYVQTMNPKTLALSGVYKSVYVMNYAGKKSRANEMNITFSSDNSKMLVYCELLDKSPANYYWYFWSWEGRGGNLLNASYAVFDQTGETINKNRSVRTELNSPLYITDQAVDNDGVVYLSGVTKMDAKNEERSGRKVFAVQYSEAGTPNAAEIALPNSNFPASCSIIVNDKSELFAVGYFTAKKMDNMLGIYSASVNTKDFKSTEAIVSEFSENFITKGLESKDAKKVIKELNKGDDFEKFNYKIHPLQLLKDGTPLYTILKQKTFTITVRDQFGTTTKYLHHYGDIITTNIKADGEPKWIVKIPRDNIYVNLYPFGGVGTTVDNDNQVNIYFTIMDYIKVLGITKLSDAKIVKHSISTNAEESQEIVYDSKKNTKAAIPGEMILLPEIGKIYMPGYEGSLVYKWFLMSMKVE
ncbi:MAG: hypothetical protein LBU51_03600 [Bacteroidales bacterium]|jgi:hypothetical protein|nr:hypothetical protein [Bacteroidales bacterium]